MGIKKNLMRYEVSLLFFLIALVVFMSFATDTFGSLGNIIAITQQMAEFGIIAVAMTIVIMTSGIDLSLGSIAGLTTIVIATVYVKTGSITLAIIIGLVMSAVCGAFNGLIISKIGVPALLVTLGSQILFKGIALVISKGNAISQFPESYYFIGQNYIGLIPIQTIVFLLISVVIYLMLKKTAFGKSIYSFGNNPVSVKFSGIRTENVLFLVYTIAGFLAGISGFIISSRVSTARADLGTVYVLQSVAAVVLGGVNIAGGSGSVWGTVIGVSIFAVLGNGLNHMGVSPFMQTFIMGLALIIVLLIGNFNIISNKIKNYRRLKVVGE